MPFCQEPISLRDAIRYAVDRLSEAHLQEQKNPPKLEALPDWARGHSEELRRAEFSLDELFDQIPEDLIQKDWEGNPVMREWFDGVCP